MKKKIMAVVSTVILTVLGFIGSVNQAQASTAGIYPNIKTPVLVGAIYDMPEMYAESRDSSGVGFVDTTGTYNTWEASHYASWVELAAADLANGDDLVIAGGPGGTVSEAQYERILEEALIANPNLTGSMVRIGGKDRKETQELVSEYIQSARYFH